MSRKTSKTYPKRIKLKVKESIFPKGYEMDLDGGMYRMRGAIHGISKKRMKYLLDNNKAEVLQW